MIARFLVLAVLSGIWFPSPVIGAHATEAVPRMENHSWMSLAAWYRFHADDVEVAEEGGVDLLFVGDSITEGWQWQDAWQEVFVPMNAANFGIGGDTTSNVLWRLEHGAVGNLAPEMVVLLIGTNNFWVNKDEPDDVVEGITAVVGLLRERFPSSKILVLSLFPRGECADDVNRLKVAAVNKELPALDNGETIFVRNIGMVFLEPDGSISKEVMPDSLHLSAEGYRRWAEAIVPIIGEIGFESGVASPES